MQPFVRQLFNLSVYLSSVCHSLSHLVNHPVFLCFSQTVSMYVCMHHIYILSVCHFVPLSVHQFIYLSVYLSIYLSVFVC